MFCSPALSLSLRNRYFGLPGKRSRRQAQSLNQQLVTLSRVVIDPKYRGAGIASLFVRRCCELAEWDWIEALAEMGHIHPFFERAGFVRVGTVEAAGTSRRQHSAIYGNPGRLLTRQTHQKSEYARPIYYVFDNRQRKQRQRP